MIADATLWDLVLGILGLGSDTPEDEVGVEAVPHG